MDITTAERIVCEYDGDIQNLLENIEEDSPNENPIPLFIQTLKQRVQDYIALIDELEH